VGIVRRVARTAVPLRRVDGIDREGLQRLRVHILDELVERIRGGAEREHQEALVSLLDACERRLSMPVDEVERAALAYRRRHARSSWASAPARTL
jgi:hypothetical protein